MGARLSTLTGEVRDIRDFERQQILPQMYTREPELRSRLATVMPDATDYRTSGVIGLLIGIPLLALSLWNLKKVADRQRNRLRHPVMRCLERFEAPEVIAATIDADVRAKSAGADFCIRKDVGGNT